MDDSIIWKVLLLKLHLVKKTEGKGYFLKFISCWKDEQGYV